MKTTLKRVAGMLLIFCFYYFTSFAVSPDQGEPVPGAEILIEQEPDDVPVQATITQNGEFTFTGLASGYYNVILVLPEKPVQSFTSKELKKFPDIKGSGYYFKKNQYFLSKDEGLFLIQLKDFKKIDEKSVTVSTKKIKGKDNKNKVCILKFKVSGKNNQLVISLRTLKPKDYNSQITNARVTGPFSQSLSNIEDN